MKKLVSLAVVMILTATMMAFFPASPAAGETYETGKDKPCDECRGMGMVVCGNCRGEGYAGSGNTLYREESTKCVKCKGKGKRICKNCGGKGKIFEYPEADQKNCGYLTLVFKVESKKNKPAPSEVTLTVDGKKIGKKSAEGRVRTFEFIKIPVSPGSNHRVEIYAFIKKGIGGYHHGRVFIHNVKIEPGKTTLGEGGRQSLRLSDDTRIEDWGEEYIGMYLNPEETKSFKIVNGDAPIAGASKDAKAPEVKKAGGEIEPIEFE